MIAIIYEFNNEQICPNLGNLPIVFYSVNIL